MLCLNPLDTVGLNQDAHFTCYNPNFLATSIQWFWNDMPVDNGTQNVIVNFDPIGGVGSLRITNVLASYNNSKIHCIMTIENREPVRMNFILRIQGKMYVLLVESIMIELYIIRFSLCCRVFESD